MGGAVGGGASEIHSGTLSCVIKQDKKEAFTFYSDVEEGFGEF